LFFFFYKEAPFPILADGLITICVGFSKAIEIAFPYLFSVNNRRNNLFEARVTERGGKIIRPPRKNGVFYPLHPAFDTFDP